MKVVKDIEKIEKKVEAEKAEAENAEADDAEAEGADAKDAEAEKAQLKRQKPKVRLSTTSSFHKNIVCVTG